jgi:hypothetical protein
VTPARAPVSGEGRSSREGAISPKAGPQPVTDHAPLLAPIQVPQEFHRCEFISVLPRWRCRAGRCAQPCVHRNGIRADVLPGQRHLYRHPARRACADGAYLCGTATIAGYGAATWNLYVTGLTGVVSPRGSTYTATTYFTLASDPDSTLVLDEGGDFCGLGHDGAAYRGYLTRVQRRSAIRLTSPAAGPSTLPRRASSPGLPGREPTLCTSPGRKPPAATPERSDNAGWEHVSRMVRRVAGPGRR